MLLAALTGALVVAGLPAGAAADQWYKADLHRHSVISADARPDLGIVANNMKSLGYNAVFLTDHDRGSRFDVHGAWANDTEIHDTLGAFATRTYGAASARTNELVTSPVKGGTKSLHMAVTSTDGGEAFVWSNRGPNLRSGDIILDFWVNPARIDAAAGVFVSASIGGDPTVGIPLGYTTSAGIVTPRKSTLMVWQLGSARANSTDAMSRVITHALPYTLNTWNHYTINVTTGSTSWNGNPVSGAGSGLADIPTADRALDINALTMLKLGVRGNSGTAEAYFDDYSLKATAPQCPSEEFAHRNSLIHDYDVPGSFTLFASREMGATKHAQHFNFPITYASEFLNTTDGAICAASNTTSAPWKFNLNGTDGIPGVHASEYPTQQNHPGTTDTVANVVATKASGADAVEAAGASTDWTGAWDQILGRNHPIIGVTGSDSHGVVDPGVDLADYMYSPSLGIDDLMKSYFEGRLFVALNNFTGRVLLNLDGSLNPYRSRYPVYLPASQTNADVNLNITGGLTAGQTVRWVRNSGAGPVNETVTPSGSSYTASRSVSLSGAFTYVRAEVRDSAGKPKALSEPIFFRSVADLPADKSFRVDNITTANGRNYTNVSTKGITSASWSNATDKLAIALSNPAGTTTDLVVTSETAPTDVSMDGSSVSPAATHSDHDAATSSSWFYDATSHVLLLRDVQSGGTSPISVTFGPGGGTDTQAPTAPGGLIATAVSDTGINLSWTASTGRHRHHRLHDLPQRRATAHEGRRLHHHLQRHRADPRHDVHLHRGCVRHSRQPLGPVRLRVRRDVRGTRHDEDVYSGGRRLRGRLAARQTTSGGCRPSAWMPRRTPRATCGST